MTIKCFGTFIKSTTKSIIYQKSCTKKKYKRGWSDLAPELGRSQLKKNHTHVVQRVDNPRRATIPPIARSKPEPDTETNNFEINLNKI